MIDNASQPLPSTSPDRKIRVLLVDDHAMVRQGLRMFIAGMLQAGFEDAEVRGMVQDNPAALLGLT